MSEFSANRSPALLLLLVLCQSARVGTLQPYFTAEYTEVHMGLPVRIILHAADEDRARTAARAAFARIATLDRMMSDYRPDSELRRLVTRQGEWTAVSAELFAVLSRAVDVARASDGAFDPTVGPLVALWREARRAGRMPERASIEAARALTGWRHLALDPSRRAVRLALPGMRLDLGGIAKGYILQDALRILRDSGVSRALVESGGDIVVSDAPPARSGWQIDAGRSDAGFRDRAARLTNAAIATSGATAQFVEIGGLRYSHVVDPRTGLGVTNRVLARVIAEDAATADALATALTIVGKQGARALLEHFPSVVASLEAPPHVQKQIDYKLIERGRRGEDLTKVLPSSLPPVRLSPGLPSSCELLSPRYSCLRAITGSTRAARRAGIQAAKSATAASAIATAANAGDPSGRVRREEPQRVARSRLKRPRRSPDRRRPAPASDAARDG